MQPVFTFSLSYDGAMQAYTTLVEFCAALPDEDARRDGDIRVIDESGEDHLYSAGRFVEIDVPQTVRRSLAVPSRGA